MGRSAGDTTTIRQTVTPIAVIIGIIWAVFLADLILPLERLGLVPRSIPGLVGIATMPFLHGNVTHLIANTVPLAVLLSLMVISRPRPWSTLIILTLLSGLALWFLGRPALHIGASGLIYGKRCVADTMISC